MKNYTTTATSTGTSKQTYDPPSGGTYRRQKFLVLVPSAFLGGGGLIRKTNRSLPPLLPRILLSFALIWLTVLICTYHYHTSKLDSIIGQHSFIKSSQNASSKFDKRGVVQVSPPNKGVINRSMVHTNAITLNELPDGDSYPKNLILPNYQNNLHLSDASNRNENNKDHSSIIINNNRNKYGPAMSACLLIKDENPRLIEWLAYHYTVVQLRYLVIAVDPDSLTSPRQVVLQRWTDRMDIQIWEDERYMNQTQLTIRLARTLRANSNNDMEEFVQLHRERQKTFLARCNLHHQAYNRTWVMHIDVDEYISYNYVHELVEPSPPSEERWNWTRTISSNTTTPAGSSPHTVFDYLHRLHPPTTACLGMVRVLFGSIITNTPLNSTTSDPHIHLDTLTYFYHENLTTLGVFGKQKVLMDVSRIHPSLLQPDKVFSIHTPIMRPRHICPTNYFTRKSYSESILRVHHYIGSWESYSSKVDVRRDKEIFTERARVKVGPNYDVKGWYNTFQQIIGGPKEANRMLAGAGILEKEWKEIVAKRKGGNYLHNNPAATSPSCALLFFSDSGNDAVGTTKWNSVLLSSIRNNVIAANPTCEIFVHTFVKLTEESQKYFSNRQSHFWVTDDMEYDQESDTILPIPLRQQWYSIQSVWKFMEIFEQRNWIRFRRIGLFSLQMVYYDPVPIIGVFTNPDAVIPTPILYNVVEQDEQWSSSPLFYGARATAKIWATDRFNSIEGYRQFQSNKNSNNSSSTSSLIHYMLHQKWALGVQMKNICFRSYVEVISNEDNNECKFADPEKAVSVNVDRVPGLVVLGMHRSGTSLLSGLLVKGLNYVVPGKLMVGNDGNKYGYFENDNVAYQNDVWLNEQGMHWNKLNIRTDPQDARTIIGGFDPNFSCLTDYCVKAKHKRLNYFQNRKLALLHYNNESLTEPWLLKDPRLCITLPMWLPSLRGSPPAVLFTFRHPVEVAKSLARRKINNVRLQSNGLKLWIWYNRLSLINSQSLCRVVTSNEAIIRDPSSEISRINNELTKCGLPLRPLNTTELLGFFHADIMHSNKNNGADSMPSENIDDCSIPPLEPSEVPKGDANYPQVYLKAMVIYCDLKNGKALKSNYSWPLLPSLV